MPQRYFWGVTAHRENGCHALTLYVRIAAVCGTFRRDPLFIGVYRNRRPSTCQSLCGRNFSSTMSQGPLCGVTRALTATLSAVWSHCTVKLGNLALTIRNRAM